MAVAEAVARRFAGRCRVGVAWTANEAAASLIAVRNGAHTIFWRSASDRERTRRTFATYLLLARALEEAAGSDCRRIARSAYHVVQRHAVRIQPIRIDEHLDLPITLAPDRDIGDTADSHQARPDRPARERGDLHLR